MLNDSAMTRFLMAWGLSGDVAVLATTVVHAAILVHFFAAAPLVLIWLERKVAGRLQDRLGPTRVGGRFGWLQGAADGIKLVQKEDLAPAAADSVLFRMAPYIVFIGSFGAFIALPWSDGWTAMELDAGLFFILAIMSVEVIGVIFAGYASGSKWSLLGGMREAAQVVSYEVPMALCCLLPVMLAGTVNIMEIGRMQSGWVWNWFVLHDPFCLIGFFVYFTVATASVKRAPFDLAEAESELVAGFHTEYSGIRWSYFFMAEYASMFAVSGLATVCFLGGWHLGVPVLEWLGLAGNAAWWAVAISGVIGFAVFSAKSLSLVFVQMWIRWSLPRLRIDQVMTTCLKYLLPISCVLLVGLAAWPLVIYAATNALEPGRGRTTLMGPALGERSAPARTSAESAGVTPSIAERVEVRR
jgi:NADH-quinone oxidoreductase subunit H